MLDGTSLEKSVKQTLEGQDVFSQVDQLAVRAQAHLAWLAHLELHHHLGAKTLVHWKRLVRVYSQQEDCHVLIYNVKPLSFFVTYFLVNSAYRFE